MHRSIPVGSTLTRIYFAVRTSPYTMGDPFDDWDAAVIAAQAAYDKRLTNLAASAAWNADVHELARKAVYLETRWVLSHPDGGSTDFMIERHPDVTKLRTAASFTA